jgi:hypothetical protein
MKLRQQITLTLAAVISIFGLTLGFASPAGALPPGCFSGRVCIWKDANFSGGTLSMIVPVDYYQACRTIPYDSFKIVASSFYNNSSRTVHWYTNDNCTGYLFSQSGYTTFPYAPSGTDNRANSFGVGTVQDV